MTIYLDHFRAEDLYKMRSGVCQSQMDDEARAADRAVEAVQKSIEEATKAVAAFSASIAAANANLALVVDDPYVLKQFEENLSFSVDDAVARLCDYSAPMNAYVDYLREGSEQ